MVIVVVVEVVIIVVEDVVVKQIPGPDVTEGNTEGADSICNSQ